MRLKGFFRRRIFVMRVQIIMCRLDSKNELWGETIIIINGVNLNMHQNTTHIFVWSLCGPAFRVLNFQEFLLPALVGFIFGACLYP